MRTSITDTEASNYDPDQLAPPAVDFEWFSVIV